MFTYIHFYLIFIQKLSTGLKKYIFILKYLKLQITHTDIRRSKVLTNKRYVQISVQYTL